MAYARYSRDSDVYVYEDVGGGFTCHCAPKGEPAFNCARPEEMVAHLREHRRRGDRVPEEAIAELLAEAEAEEKTRKAVE